MQRKMTWLACLAGLTILGAGCGDDDGGGGDDGSVTWDAAPGSDGQVPQRDAAPGSDAEVPDPPADECDPPVDLVDTSTPDAVVGTGTPGSCTEAALDAALTVAGVITFDCGPNPFTIAVTSTKEITEDTVLDGEGLVTLSGEGSVRILSVPSSFERGWPFLTVQRLTFVDGNSPAGGDDTEVGGGAIWVLGGTLTVIDSTFMNNQAPLTGQDVAGGAVYNVGSGDTIITGSVFTGNQASSGGAVGILHSQLTIVNTIISNNQATGTGGNPGNGGNGGGVYIDGVDQDIELCGVTLEGNTANAHGGGLFRVSNNGVGDMIIDRVSVLSNTMPDVSPASAGGMYLQGVQIQLTNSTFAWNESRFSAAMFIGPNGTTLEMTNVTIAENTAISGLAGGMAISDGVTGRIRNCTFARNAAPGDVAFAAATTGGAGLTLQNTIVDGHIAGNGWNPISCRDTLQEGGGNLQWPVERSGGGSDDPDALCSPSILVQDSQLGDLQDNGGPTLTILPAGTSPAAGRGANCPQYDQRGETRASSCTAGAAELP